MDFSGLFSYKYSHSFHLQAPTLAQRTQQTTDFTMKRETMPSWLELLLATQFFTTCANHLLASRNECNLFCTQCETKPAAFCNYCRSSDHSTHRVIQVRNHLSLVSYYGTSQFKHFIPYKSQNSEVYSFDVLCLVAYYVASQIRQVCKNIT